MKTGYCFWFFDLKFNLYFSAFCLTVINFGLQFCLDEFREKVSGSKFAIFFSSVLKKLFLERCLIGVA